MSTPQKLEAQQPIARQPPVAVTPMQITDPKHKASRPRGGGAGKDCFLGLLGCFLCFECCEGCCDCVADIVCCPCEMCC